MHRIMVPHLAHAGGTIRITGDEAHHALRVKRLRVGETVELIDGEGTLAPARILSGGRAELVVELTSPPRTVEPPTPAIDVYACPPKASHLDLLVDGLTQVGAASLTLLRTPLSQPPPTPTRIDRLRRIAIESAKQCGRPRIMDVRAGATLDEALSSQPGLVIVMAHPDDGALSTESTGRYRLLIGPEGGWQDSELAQARAAGARLCGFGPHLMRIEIAAVAGVVAIRERTRAD